MMFVVVVILFIYSSIGYVPQFYQHYPQYLGQFFGGTTSHPVYPYHGYPPQGGPYPPQQGYYHGQPAPSTQLPPAGSSHHAGVPPYQYTEAPMQGLSYQGNIQLSHFTNSRTHPTLFTPMKEAQEWDYVQTANVFRHYSLECRRNISHLISFLLQLLLKSPNCSSVQFA